MMNAIVYSKNAPNGIKMVNIPKPTLNETIYDPTKTSTVRSILFTILNCLYHLLSQMMRLLRYIFPSIPSPYGELHDRQWVLCRVHAVGLNPVDAKFLYGDKLPHFCLPLVQWFVDNRICGIDFSGVVEEAPNHCPYKKGDEIFGTIPPFSGSLAEFVRVPTDFINHKPKNLSFSQACAIPLVALTVLQAFEDNHLKPGQNVLVLGGSGGTGHVAVQIAKVKGANVTTIVGSKNVNFAKTLGADDILCYDTNSDLMGDLFNIKLKQGSFSFVFDSVSSHDPRDRVHSYEKRIRSTRPSLLNGVYIFIGGVFNDWVLAHLKRYFGINWFDHGRQLFWVRFPNSTELLATIRQLCETNRFHVTIAQRFPFTEKDVREAFEFQMSRRVTGKIVIELLPE